ncbi:MAG: class I SAM-dependent methyltransferase [Pseudomonadota bacterium]
MSRSLVSAVYDQLHRFEAASREQAYPIHKRLRLPEDQDVYDLIARSSAVPAGGLILDAGCGTGFGTMRIAAATGCHAHGISLSAAEVAHAEAHALREGLADQVSFSVASFDDPLDGTYDLVIAVESIKHSTALPQALRRLTDALHPGGALMVVDDVLVGNADQLLIDRIQDSWALFRVYRDSDFQTAIPAQPPITEDLTDLVQRRSRADLWLRTTLLRLASRIRRRNRPVYDIFRAGLDLESLYRVGCMRYHMMSWRR